MNDPCQVSGCVKDATYHSFPANASHPDEGGMQTCDGHLAEGMSTIQGQPTPEHWRVFPIHESSPPLCLVTCPTCHPARDGR